MLAAGYDFFRLHMICRMVATVLSLLHSMPKCNASSSIMKQYAHIEALPSSVRVGAAAFPSAHPCNTSKQQGPEGNAWALLVMYTQLLGRLHSGSVFVTSHDHYQLAQINC